MNADEKMDRILQIIQEIKDEMDKFVGNTTNGYTDRQLYDMKKVLKWDKLAEATGIPRSTLFYRVNKYKETIGEVPEPEK